MEVVSRLSGKTDSEFTLKKLDHSELPLKTIDMASTNFSAVFNSTSPTTTMHSFSMFYFLISVIVINIVMAFLAACLNILIIFTFVKTASLRETPSNVLVLGLAIADFTAGVVAQPAFLSYFLYFLLSKDDEAKASTWEILHALSHVILSVSFLNIIAITADRFLAVHLHLRYQELVTTRRYGIALACIWIFCLLSVTTSLLLEVNDGHAVLLTLYLSLGVINLVLLAQITRVIRRHSVQIQAQQQSVQQSIDMPRYKKSVNTMYFVCGAFLLTFISSVSIGIVELFFHDIWGKSGTFLDAGGWTLVMLNTVLNPIIYCLRVEEIHDAIVALLQSLH